MNDDVSVVYGDKCTRGVEADGKTVCTVIEEYTY